MFCPACGQEATEPTNFCPNCGHRLNWTGPGADFGKTLGGPAAEAYAGFWRRLVAYFIDGVLVFIIGIGAGALAGSVLGTKMGLPGDLGGFHLGLKPGAGGPLEFVLTTVISWLYWAGLESSGQQATLGKMALGLKVTDLQGEPISFARATGRYFGKFLSALIFCIGFMMAGWTARKQALHDIMAGTLVVKKRDSDEPS